MTGPRASIVVCGDVVVAAGPRGLEHAEAIGIAEGRVVSAGRRDEVLSAAAPEAAVHDAGPAAVVPGLHDFHIHLVGVARSRAGVSLDDATDAEEVARRLRAHAQTLGSRAWVSGRGWSEAQLRDGPGPLVAAVGDRPTFVSSHDGHSAWASPAAFHAAGLTAETPEPEGGRIERDVHGAPTGILRETALDLVARVVPRLRGSELRPHLAATLAELAALGITGASEAGDYTHANGTGADADLGDSYSTLTDLTDLVDGRLRLSLGIPADALPAAVERGLRTGETLAGRRTMRFGWAKAYADGALGSGTAALFEPRTCGEDPDTGILRVAPDALDALMAAGRRARIGLAVHAIGDRAAATVLDAMERAPARPAGVPADRIEHAQLMRAADRRRMPILGVTASIQPIHAAADRDMVEACWAGRQHDAYAWRSLLEGGATVAAGSDAPVESVNPWLGMFAAVHRRLPSDSRADWRPSEAMTSVEALAAYTLAPAIAAGASDEGHLQIGARADLAVLNVGVDVLLAAGDDLAGVRSVLTLVGGTEVQRA